MENKYDAKINSRYKKGKMGKLEYEIEPRNVLLIPDNFNIKNNNIKIIEKEFLPKEKNYFISESNFQLIKDVLNEKEKNINHLKQSLEIKDKEIFLLKEENKKLEDANNELILQIQRNDIYFNKIYQLLKFLFNYYNCLNDDKIQKFIKKENLYSLFNKQNIVEKEENLKKDNNFDNDIPNMNGKENMISTLFGINQDEIMKELEKYKKMYNEVRKHLNYITNIKSKDKQNQDDLINQLLESQKKLNELNKEIQNYIKENSYLKLLCKNMMLEKKISDLDDNEKIIKELEQSLQEEKNKNINLNKENEILKKNTESLLKEINQLRISLNEINVKNNLKNLEFDKIKTEKEKFQKIINEYNLKSNEELKNRNQIYSKKKMLEFNKQNKSNWKKLDIENTEKLFYKPENDYNDDSYNKIKFDYEGMNEVSEQYMNTDLLMFLYNKSKQLEQNVTNK